MASPQRTPDRRRLVLAAGALALLVGLAGVGAWQLRGSPPQSVPTTVAAPGAEAAPLCGVADVGRYSALAGDPTTDVVDTVAADFAIDGTTPHALATDGDDLLALAADEDGLTVVRLGPDGKELGRFASPTPPGGRTPSTFAPVDGGVVVTASARSDQSAVEGHGSDGSTVWALDLGELGRGPVAAVIDWSAGVGGAAFAVAFADSPRLALVSADGDLVEPDGPEIPGEAFFPQVDGTLVARADDDDDGVRLSRWSSDGKLLREFGGPVEGSPNGGPAELERPTGVAVGPHGGLLVAGPRYRVVEVGDDGVWRRVGLSGQGQGAVFDFAEQSPLVRSGDHFYFISSDEDGGASLSRVDVPGMDALLDSPVTYDINHASSLDRLGFGAGLVTDVPYGYFRAGEEPAVHVEFDDWWGAVSADYELRYRVSGDPWAEPPVEPVSGTLALPEDGGRAALDLPPARPGPYDVHAELVDRVTGEVRTATCLRYAVGAPGAAFDPAGLADGADWGGAQPVRGVQLADQLGIGSYRVQLAFGDLVPDLAATPSVAALDLDALPGAVPGGPFAAIAEAAALAARSDVQVYVQVGQGGEAEHEAVQDGTWGAWAGAIAEAFAAGAPDVSLWAPWNEPNNTGFGDGGEYARDVLAPFAQAVKTAAPGAQVIGGNALNLVVPWYRQVIDAGGCDSLDIVGIHPYTGFNRSWDEEGADGPLGQIEELNAALEGCGSPPVWNTESGWWSDGPGNHWAHGHDVARTLLWQRALGVDEWTYFFSEGGWGEGGFSWSLLQVDSFVKPGALAMSTVAALLEDRPPPEVVEPAAPHTHVMRVGERPGEDDQLTAVWTDDLVMEVQATADQDATLVLTDVYGATREVDAGAGEPVPLPVTGSPVFISAPGGVEVAISTAEPAGPNLLAGGRVSASSTGEDTDPAAVIAPGGADATPWRAGARTSDGALDLSPWLQVDLPAPATIDRVAVESAGLRCCTSALRDYTVSVQGADGEWTEVGSSTGLFYERTSLVRFEPVEAQAVRVQVPTTTERGVRVPRLNYSGQTGGLHPAWSPVVPETSWPASVVSLTAYGPPS